MKFGTDIDLDKIDMYISSANASKLVNHFHLQECQTVLLFCWVSSSDSGRLIMV